MPYIRQFRLLIMIIDTYALRYYFGSMEAGNDLSQRPSVRDRLMQSIHKPGITIKEREKIVINVIKHRLRAVLDVIISICERDPVSQDVMQLLQDEIDAIREHCIIEDIIATDPILEMVALTERRMAILFRNHSYHTVGSAVGHLRNQRRAHKPHEITDNALERAEENLNQALKDFFVIIKGYAFCNPLSKKIFSFLQSNPSEVPQQLIDEIVNDPDMIHIFSEIEKGISLHSSFGFRPGLHEMLDLLSELKIINNREQAEWESNSVAY